jgi:hypothetical protein
MLAERARAAVVNPLVLGGHQRTLPDHLQLRSLLRVFSRALCLLAERARTAAVNRLMQVIAKEPH